MKKHLSRPIAKALGIAVLVLSAISGTPAAQAQTPASNYI